MVWLCVVELCSNARLNGHRFEVKRFLRGSRSLPEKLTIQLSAAILNMTSATGGVWRTNNKEVFLNKIQDIAKPPPDTPVPTV